MEVGVVGWGGGGASQLAANRWSVARIQPRSNWSLLNISELEAALSLTHSRACNEESLVRKHHVHI